jgi:glutamine phosphoribosylpyrophosphate amidotransferase
MLVDREMGLVRQLFDEATLATLQGRVAIGHTRHSTAGGARWENAQPTVKINAAGGGMAVAHNGNRTSAAALAGQLIPQESPPSWPVQPRAASDTDVMAQLLAGEAEVSLGNAIVRTMARLEGLTQTDVRAAVSPAGGLCTAWVTGSHPIPMPGGAVADLGPFAATQPPTLPLPNPEPEVAR